jgi:ribosomal protein S3
MKRDYKETQSSAFYIFFARLFGWKYEVKSKKYRKTLHQFFNYGDWGYETTITRIKVFKQKSKTTVQIETYRPGLLIGKGGVFINGLEKHLSEKISEDIKISLLECKLWDKLYD